MQNVKKLLPGLFFVLIISYVSILINDLLKTYINLEALTIAIIIGIIYNNTVKTQEIFQEGIKFSLKKLLKVGIVLLGFKLNFNAVLNLGPKILIMVLIFVPFALILSIGLRKLFKLNKRLATLIGVGSCICGASAVVAMAPCIDAEEDDSVIAVSVVSFLGAIGVLIYSAIAVGGLNLNPTQYGVWSGLSLHGVAHAIAAAFALGDASGEIGTFVKMARVLMLVPVSIALGFMFKKDNSTKSSVKFPMYVLYFIIAGIINSIGIIPLYITNILVYLSTLFILMSMTAMGLSVSFKTIVNKGVNALLSGTVIFIILSSTSLLVIMRFI